MPQIIGCADFPTDVQGMKRVKLIQDFINEEYKMDGKTVISAFKMASKQELYLDGRRIDPSTFGHQLSVNVVGKVLTAYKEHLRLGKSSPRYNPNQLPPHETKKLTPEEAHDLILKWTKEERQTPDIAPYVTAYRYLLGHGLVKDVRGQKGGKRSIKMLGQSSQIEVSAERVEAEKWYKDNVI